MLYDSNRILSQIAASTKSQLAWKLEASDRGWQDKAGFPAAGTSFLSVCLHIVLCRSLGNSIEISERRFFQLYFSFNAPRAVAHDMLQ
jgi:hypothetical protein